MLDVWVHQKGVDEDEILSFYPQSIARDIKKQLSYETVEKIPIIKGWNETTHQKIYNVLKCQIYLNGEHIYDSGEVAHSMFIVCFGKVDCYHENSSTIYATYEKGKDS